MSTQFLTTVLPTLMRELVDGSPNPRDRTYMLNQGDAGLLASLDRLSARAASSTHAGGSSIAAHVDHLRYGLMVLNKWAAGTPVPRKELDWTASWKKKVLSDAEWQMLREELRREAMAWTHALRTPRDVSEIEAGWMAGSVAHVAYHFGAIRQIDRAARGPTAEDEAHAQAALRPPATH